MSTIESLELEIQSNAKSAEGGIDSLTQSLEKLKTATKGGLGLTAVANQMKEIGAASNTITSSSIANVNGLAEAVKALGSVKISNSIAKQITAISTSLSTANFEVGKNKIDTILPSLTSLASLPKLNLNSYSNGIDKLQKNLAKLNAVDIVSLKSKITQLAEAFKPLGDEMQKVASGMSALPTKLQQLINVTNRVPATNTKAAGSFTDLYNRIRVGFGTLKRAITLIGSSIEKSNDYVENLNLFTVSMGEYAKGAMEYAEQVSEALGIDTSDWIRAQGVFMTMATGFGVASDRASVMSKNLTQLGYDLASFYNIDVEDAMTKLKSGLAGELEPLRAIGYDLSQAKLEATALELGITKAVSSMTQAEKAQLRYYAILNQVTVAQGDMARTLDDPANQLRVLKSQISMAAREIGNIFIPALTSVLPYAIAVTKVIGTLAKSIAGLFGYKPKVIEESTSTIVESTGEMSENLEEAQEEAKKLKSYMLGIDELNVINPNTEGAGETSNELDFALPEYDFLAGAVESKVNIIVEEMLEWLGITEDINTWTELLDTRFGNILITVGAIGAALGALNVGAGVQTLIKLFGTIGSSGALSAIGSALGAISAPVLAIVAAVVALVGGLALVYKHNEEVRASVNSAVDDIKKSLVPMFEFVSDTILPNLKNAWAKLIEIVTPLGEWISMVFVSIWEDMLIPAMENLSTNIIPAVTETLQNLWNDVLVPIGNFLSIVFKPIISSLAELLTYLWQGVVIPLADANRTTLTNAFLGLMTILNDTVIPVFEGIISVLQFLWTDVCSPFVDFLVRVFSPIAKIMFEDIKVGIEGLKNLFVGVIDFIVGVFTADWKRALGGLLTIVESLINRIIDGWNALKKAINSLSIDIPEWLGGGTLGFNLEMTKHISISKFAEGGFPEQGQMFIAREAGAEMVGSIGRRTAVANNDQIVAGIAGGVAEANEEQNVLLREQNSLLRALLEKDSGVYLDGKNLANSVEKYQRERGRVLIAGGVL